MNKRLLWPLVGLVLSLPAHGASFPYITLNAKTNRISDNGITLTRNGIPITGGFAGAIATNGTAASPGDIVAFTSSTNVGKATSQQIQNALGQPYQATNSNLTAYSGIGTNNLLSALGGAPRPTQISLTHAGTITLNLAAEASQADLSTVTGAVTLATSNLAAGNAYVIFGRNSQATNCNVTAPSWNWQTGAPMVLTAGKTWTISLWSRGTVDTNVWAWFQEAP